MSEERRDREGITVLRVAEAEIGENLGLGLQSLLGECFPGYPRRSYRVVRQCAGLWAGGEGGRT